MNDLGDGGNGENRFAAAWIRTSQLLSQGRWDEADAWIRQFLSTRPDDPAHLRALAVCRLGMGRTAEARDTLSRLFALEGAEPDLLRLRSRIDLLEGHHRDAFRSAMAAITADPADAENHVALARWACAVRDWPRMESCLRQALALDAQHAEALHLLSVARSVQGDHDGGGEAARQLLSVDPESATGHSTLGWSLLRQGDHDGANVRFRESLRIDPSHPGARAGLLESLRARNLPYRLYLGWNHWMQRLSGGRQLAVLVGLLVGMQLLTHVRSGWPGILATLAVFAYFVFAMWTWMAPGFGNLLLLADRRARPLLGRTEIHSALFVGGVFTLGVLACLSVFATFSALSLVAGGSLVLSAIASSLWIDNEHPIGLRIYQAAAIAFPAFAVAVFLGWTEPVRHLPEAFLVLTLAGSFRLLRR